MNSIVLYFLPIVIIVTSCNTEITEVSDNLIGNYFDNTGSDYWVYSIQKDFLISDCQFWNYDKIRNRGDVWTIRLIGDDRTKQLTINLSDSVNIAIMDDGLVYQCSKNSAQINRKLNIGSISWRPDTAVVRGYVENYFSTNDNDSKILFYVENYLMGYRQSYTANIDTIGRFEVKLNLLNSQDISLLYQEVYKRFFISPLDTLMVLMDTHDPDNFHYMGNQATVCYDIQQYSNEITAIPSPKEMNYYIGKEPQEYRIFWDSVKYAKDKTLNDIFSSDNLSQEYRVWQQKQSENIYYKELMDFSWKSPRYGGGTNKRLDWDHPYYSFIDSINQNDTIAQISANYMYLAYNLHRKLNMRDKVRDIEIWEQDLAQIRSQNPNYSEEKLTSEALKKLYNRQINSILNTEYTLFRDIRLTLSFYHLIKTRQIELIDSGYKLIEHKIDHKPYLEEITKVYYEFKRKEVEFLNTPISLIKTNSPGNQLILDIVEKHKNKVIILDFWFTGCAPCRRDFKKFKEIKEKLVGDDIVFVYLCFESSEKNWRYVTQEFNLQGDHYLLTNDQFAYFSDLFDITSAPRYILIDKEGKVANSNFIRPSSTDNFIRNLSKYLN